MLALLQFRRVFRHESANESMIELQNSVTIPSTKPRQCQEGCQAGAFIAGFKQSRAAGSSFSAKLHAVAAAVVVPPEDCAWNAAGGIGRGGGGGGGGRNGGGGGGCGGGGVGGGGGG